MVATIEVSVLTVFQRNVRNVLHTIRMNLKTQKMRRNEDETNTC